MAVSYKARVQVKPGVKVAIRNDAHWDGYELVIWQAMPS